MKPDLNFEYIARKEKKVPVYYGPDNPSWGRKTWRTIWLILVSCLLTAVSIVVLFFLMGALKLLGVKSLEP